jgi:hypothetical protein
MIHPHDIQLILIQIKNQEEKKNTNWRKLKKKEWRVRRRTAPCFFF